MINLKIKYIFENFSLQNFLYIYFFESIEMKYAK